VESDGPVPNGCPRLTEADREFLGRLTDGDLAEEFLAALDAANASDPLLVAALATAAGLPRCSRRSPCRSSSEERRKSSASLYEWSTESAGHRWLADATSKRAVTS
jgi:hypothetical protein